MQHRLGGRAWSVNDDWTWVFEIWTIQIVHEVSLGHSRFDELQQNLGVAPSTLARRLQGLTARGILERQPYRERPTRHAYRLTASGQALVPILAAFGEWGRRHNGEGPLARWMHVETGSLLEPVVADAHSGAVLDGNRGGIDWDWPPEPSEQGRPDDCNWGGSLK